MSKAKKKPDLTSLMGGSAKVSGATPRQVEPETTSAPAPEPESVVASPAPTPVVEPKVEQSLPKAKPQPKAKTKPAPKTRTAEKAPTQAKAAPKKKSEDYMMTSIAFDADDMKDLQEVSMSFMANSGSLKYPTRNMVAKVGIKAAHILSQEDPERLLELFELIRSKDRRYAENRD